MRNASGVFPLDGVAGLPQHLQLQVFWLFFNGFWWITGVLSEHFRYVRYVLLQDAASIVHLWWGFSSLIYILLLLLDLLVALDSLQLRRQLLRDFTLSDAGGPYKTERKQLKQHPPIMIRRYWKMRTQAKICTTSYPY